MEYIAFCFTAKKMKTIRILGYTFIKDMKTGKGCRKKHLL